MDTDRIAGSAKNFAGKLEDAADSAVNFTRDAYGSRGETLRDGSRMVAKKVQENPLGSLLVAGGIGFALALLMARPPRRPPARSRYH
jgi:ElaB/YqjD/DUF883 family membrane-anchored ribosome-binding protein